MVLLAWSLALPALAVPLTGSGTHLSLAGLVDGDGPAVQTWSVVDNGGSSLTASFSSPAQTPWIGSASGTGAIPGGGFSGDSSWDFTTLTNGSLPSGTALRLGDLDGGSGPEILTLIAYDAADQVITTPWLEEPIAFDSNGVPFSATSTPGWNWTGTSYIFDGNTVTGSNPSLGITLLTNVDIFSLDAIKPNIGHGFVLEAPLTCQVDTGVASDGSVFPIGTQEDEWVVTVDPGGGVVPRGADVIATSASWNVIPGTAFIAANQQTNSTTEFEICFDFQSVDAPSLSLEALVDNNADFSLNGNPIGSITGGTAANFNLPAIPISTTNAAFFTAGENCLEVDVHNNGSITGLNIQGTVTNGAGCQVLPAPAPPPLTTVPSATQHGRMALLGLLVLGGAWTLLRRGARTDP
ncbi:MAG: hypothetical protein AAF430_06970 [Myxococcota bacterium]